ncbi:uncharacterized protein PHALS_11305 [Plasmopara halstedii]|uniref:Uncharacterized protein n=1 Tax=Plasmopara halstedii TaxID=4781 RepID=A0A0P1AKF4_PLAHL|nr:uncharacterized protein PHALS_11305 [Plasmopara halstedii]CEG41140.1 hypothetical protein PHALS_11305 [Plasmopara halstedii]|eukprot:XP_024577509.1 hypothetical protein PHALS_11305 [Plasmopara halstedii]
MKSTVATAVMSDVPIVAEAALAMEEKLKVYHDLVVCDESAVAYVLDPRLKRFAGLDAATQVTLDVHQMMRTNCTYRARMEEFDRSPLQMDTNQFACGLNSYFS